MTQLIIPFISPGSTPISNIVNVFRENDKWTYFLGTYPIFTHKASDLAMFRLITSQFIEAGSCRQVDIIRTFGISKSSVNRSLNKLRTQGPNSFFTRRSSRRGGTILTPDILLQAQHLLDSGCSSPEVADDLDIKRDTIRKALSDGRLKKPRKDGTATTKSSRTVVDAQAAEEMGTACTRPTERMVAAFGVCDGAPVRFEACLDVPYGGVLCALPSLLSNGLLKHAHQLLGQIKGYYTTFHIIILLSFMALCRIKTIEQLKGYSPGEFGKLLGLDRIPEVRCLRKKMANLSAGDAATKWAAHLAQHWMQANPETVGTLYVDGHVRLYHGSLTTLPRRYVSRQRLCLRGTTDYWVNDAIGQPFFVVEQAVDPGLLNVLTKTIVPRLLKEIPSQPSDAELENNPYLCRFILVFDREGYSPDFFRRMWQDHRIACLTYHKHPRNAWNTEWFEPYEVTMPDGETVTMRLAEQGSLVGSGKDPVWMREVRKVTASGHQTSIISTAYQIPLTQLAASMFSRWCQENFFRYMMQHFAIDLLEEYGTTDFPDTEKVVNPKWRKLNRERNSLTNKLRTRKAAFGHLALNPQPQPEIKKTQKENKQENSQEKKSTQKTGKKQATKKYTTWLRKKSELLEEINQFEHQLTETKVQLKQTENHISWDELEEKDKFQRLIPNRKRLMDTVRMVAYRAETALAHILKEPGVELAQARRLLQNLFVTEADIVPDQTQKILHVRVHNTSRPAANKMIEKIMKYLNEAECKYPGTEMKIIYELRGNVSKQ